MGALVLQRRPRVRWFARHLLVLCACVILVSTLLFFRLKYNARREQLEIEKGRQVGPLKIMKTMLFRITSPISRAVDDEDIVGEDSDDEDISRFSDRSCTFSDRSVFVGGVSTSMVSASMVRCPTGDQDGRDRCLTRDHVDGRDKDMVCERKVCIHEQPNQA